MRRLVSLIADNKWNSKMEERKTGQLMVRMRTRQDNEERKGKS